MKIDVYAIIPLMNGTSDAYGEASEFWQEFTSTTKEMFQNLASQSISIQESYSGIDKIISLLFLIFLMLAVFLVTGRIFRAARRRSAEKHFDIVISDIHNVPEMNELKKLASDCVKLAEEIDSHTGKKGFSKRSAMIVFMMAKQMNMNFTDAVLAFCTALVHDAGFLDSPTELFCAEVHSIKEKKIMRTHIHRAYSYLSFVPKKYMVNFINAITYHHENMDGTGFPDGLSGNEIPLYARMIRVAEDYVYMVEKSDYNKPLEGYKAVSRLRKKSAIYDQDIVNVLESLLENTVV